jgi:hypothetical protein
MEFVNPPIAATWHDSYIARPTRRDPSVTVALDAHEPRLLALARVLEALLDDAPSLVPPWRLPKRPVDTGGIRDPEPARHHATGAY